ncbi:MAG TPA: hypothetical protein VLH56_09660, partial [Dissulfurispiraceae bacterium]|nr:hypothetical protein [Dissulfurispiraceae bacterium]
QTAYSTHSAGATISPILGTVVYPACHCGSLVGQARIILKLTPILTTIFTETPSIINVDLFLGPCQCRFENAPNLPV